jgi:DNA polymerase III epsilon subunit-like protein
MALREELTADGVKLRDSRTGELKGSVGKGVAAPQGLDVPTIAPSHLAGEGETPADIDSAFERFAEARQDTLVSEFVTDPNKVLDKMSPAERAAYELSRTMPTGLTEDQALDVFGALKKTADRLSTRAAESEVADCVASVEDLKARIEAGLSTPDAVNAAIRAENPGVADERLPLVYEETVDQELSMRETELADARDYLSYKEKELVPPTEEEWKTWVDQARSRIQSTDGMNEAARTAALKALDEAEAGLTPDAKQFYVLKRAEKRSWEAVYGLKSQAETFTGFTGVSEDVVRHNIHKARSAYYTRIANGEAGVPADEKEAYEQYKQSFVWHGSRKFPKDEATVYSHFQAEQAHLYADGKTPRVVVVLDTETTGLSPVRDEITQFAAIKYLDGKELERVSIYVKPDRMTVDGKYYYSGARGARRTNGIKQSFYEGAPSQQEMIQKVESFTAGSVIVGHNVAFDVNMINSAAKKHDVTMHWSGVADTLSYSLRHTQQKKTVIGDDGKKVKVGDGPESNKLGILIRYHGHELDESRLHEALYDVEQANVLYGMFSKQFEKRRKTLRP